MSKATQLQQLSELKPGTLILVEINGKPTSGKFEEVLKTGGSKLFKYREQPGNMIRRAEVSKFISVAPAPEEGGKVIAMHTAAVKPAKKQAAEPAVEVKKKGERVSINPESGHKWEKSNLVTQVKGGRSFDAYKCLTCGMEAKRYGIGSTSMEITKANAKGAEQCQPIPEKTPLEMGITHIKLLAIGSNHPAYATLKVGEIYPVINAPEEFQKFAADVWIEGAEAAPARLFREEWVKANANETFEAMKSGDTVPLGGGVMMSKLVISDIAGSSVPYIRPEVAGLSEFGAKIVETVSMMETEGKVEAISVASLAAKMGEEPKKVAAAFTALNKTGLVSQSGEKGARLIQLTAAGWEYINGPETAPAAIAMPVGDAVPEKEFTMSPEHIASFGKLSDVATPITEIFDANNLRDIEERDSAKGGPKWIEITPSATADAYFDAKLGEFGAEAQYFFTPDLYDKSPVEGGNRIQQPEPAKKAAKAAKAEKPAKAAKIKAEPKAAGPRSKGGRPAPGEKSVRELVLDEIKFQLSGDNATVTLSEAMKLIAGRMEKTTIQVNNAITKLSYAGYISINPETNKIASPLALTEKGWAGYSTNYGKNIRPEVEAMIAAGKTDIEIARALGCEHGYIHDVRTGRGKKAKEVAAE